MKSRYKFEILDMEDGIVAVPVGENADELHSVLRLNQTSKDILEMLKVDSTEDNICMSLMEKYDTSEADVKKVVHSFVSQLKEVGIVE